MGKLEDVTFIIENIGLSEDLSLEILYLRHQAYLGEIPVKEFFED